MPRFSEKGPFIQHPLEQKFNASAWDILEAVNRGFRAQVDVKGKLAELFLHRRLVKLERQGLLTELDWRDKDGIPDFGFTVNGQKLQLECKNVRSGKEVFKDAYKIEIQKTRSQIGGGPKRGYKIDEFDILAACLFNQTSQWQYLFAATAKLERRIEPHADYLVVMHKVPYTPKDHWRTKLEEVIADGMRS